MKYIAFYDTGEYRNENRSVAPSAADVVSYMADVMSDTEPIHIISPSRTLNKSGVYRGRTISVDERVTLTQPPSFGVRTRVGRHAAILYTRLWLFFYLLFRLQRGERIVVYHSLSVMRVVTLLKKLKRLSLILEVRELYSDVKQSATAKRTRDHELDFFNIADAYIFPTELLNGLINRDGKPYVIATGVYKSRPHIAKRANDSIVHVVYAGTLVPCKGVSVVVDASCCLGKGYSTHIIGFGVEEDIKDINDSIARARSNWGAAVGYDGLLRGEEMNRYLQQCHIGLVVTRSMDASYNDTSFPSKILTYLANGLDVMSARIPSVEKSPVGKYVYYYDEQTPQAIAEAIKGIPVGAGKDKTELLSALDAALRADMRKLMYGKG